MFSSKYSSSKVLTMKKIFVSENCPVCGTGNWLPKSDEVYAFRHARKEYRIDGLHYAECNKCGTRGDLPGQRKENQQLVQKFQEALVGYISSSDVLALREKYQLTQKYANVIFGGGTQGFSKWERGISSPAGPTARLIKLALKYPEVMNALVKEVEVSLEEPINVASPRPTVKVFYQTHLTSGEAEDCFNNCVSSIDDEEGEDTWLPVGKRVSRKLSA